MQRLPGAIFQLDNTRPLTARVSQDCLCTLTTFLGSNCSPDMSPIEHTWEQLGWRVGHPTSLNELEASTDRRCRQPGIHRAQCIVAGGHHPFWHGRRVAGQWRYTPKKSYPVVRQKGQTSSALPGASTGSTECGGCSCFLDIRFMWIFGSKDVTARRRTSFIFKLESVPCFDGFDR
ncbi:transposable element Tcb2 transposase [Trichonephila clavipes]|nr:transposable element Tcb2 transposase [Trichonephila clavipes]